MGFWKDVLEFCLEIIGAAIGTYKDFLVFIRERILRDRDPDYILLFTVQTLIFGSFALIRNPDGIDFMAFAILFLSFFTYTMWLGYKKQEMDWTHPGQVTLNLVIISFACMLMQTAIVWN